MRGIWLVVLVGCGDGSPGELGSYLPSNEAYVALESHDASDSVGGSLLVGFPHPDTTACFEVQGDVCNRRDCRNPSRMDSGGAITITGAAMSPIGEEPQQGNDYGGLVLTTPMFLPDAQISVSGTGADYAPFSGTLAAPREAHVTLPERADHPTIDTAKPLELAWDGTGSGMMQVQLAATATVTCRFDLAAGHATIGPELLAEFAGQHGRFEMSVVTETRIDLPSHEVTLSATAGATWAADDAIVNVGADFE